MKTQIEKMQLHNKFYWFYLVGFFVILTLPILNLPPWFSPPDWGKTIVFRILLSILIFVFLWQALSKEQITIKTSLPFWLLVSLLGIFLLANIFSLDPHFSFWGSPYRSGGFLNFAFYIIFAILVFSIIRQKDWQKIWDFAIFIGILVSIVAIFQQYGLISKIFIPFGARAPSTIGGPIFLAIYLLLLSFLTLSFGLKQAGLKKLFYFLSFLLFFLVAVFITQTRAVIIGYLVGFLFFILFYPVRKFSVSLGLKLTALIILLSGIYGIYFVNTQTELPQFIQKNRFLNGVTARLSIKAGLADSRISGWKVALPVLKDRPILGYGPENFAIGFDKFYDPSLPKITKEWGSWWDRAHNFIFDIGVTAGIPALIIYLALFGVLFFQLQKLKTAEKSVDEYVEKTPKVIYHGIQATFIGYLVANFFSFDTFSTYLISFLLIGYSLHLIYQNNGSPTSIIPTQFSSLILKWRGLLLFLLFVLLIWFIWVFNAKPFQINKEINWASYESKGGYHEKAIVRMENLLAKRSFLDAYLRLKYADIIDEYIKAKPELTISLVQKAIEILKENTNIMPYYTRDWLLLGSYTNILIERGQIKLKDEANSYFEKAHQLSPKRQEVFTEWIKTDLLTGEYQKAKERAEKCIALNEKLGDCYWLMGLTQGYLKNFEGLNYYANIAQTKGYDTQSENAFLQLTKVYAQTQNYQDLVKTLTKLISINPNNPQYHASLAAAYQKIGDLEMAKKEALRVLELQPEARKDVEEFLKSLE